MTQAIDSFLERNSWITTHSLYDPVGNLISPKFLLMKFLYQKNLLQQGRFDEARKFGIDEGLHDTSVYRLLTDIDVPQRTILDRLDSDQRLHIEPAKERGSYLFQEDPHRRKKLIFDPQTIRQLYWHDKAYGLFKGEGPKAAADMAKEKHLAHDIINHFNHHRIYRRAIKHLDAALARMINDRENLGYDWQTDFDTAMDTHLNNYLELEKRQLLLAKRYANQFNFVVFENGRTSFVRPIKSINSSQMFIQEEVPTLYTTIIH